VSGFFILNLLHLNFFSIFVLNLKYIVMENQQERELTTEELAAQKEQMLMFYTDSVPYLEAQLKYEELLSKIDEARFKRSSIQMQYAMMAQAQNDAQEEIDTDESDTDTEKDIAAPSKRKLRKG
jgi:hypothetical protein